MESTQYASVRVKVETYRDLKKAAIDEGRAIHEKDGLCGKPEALFQRHGNPGLRVSKKGKKPAGERPPSLRSFCPTRIL